MEGKAEKHLTLERKIFELTASWGLTALLIAIVGFVGGFIFSSGLSSSGFLLLASVLSIPVVFLLFYLVKSTNKVISLARSQCLTSL